MNQDLTSSLLSCTQLKPPPKKNRYCSDFLDVIMRVLASGGENLRALMAGHPLQPILQQLGELPPEVTYKVSRGGGRWWRLYVSYVSLG